MIARPMIGSATGAPSATHAALRTTPIETIASERACSPSAMSAGLSRRRPPPSRTRAAIALPAAPTAPASGEREQVVGRERVDDPVDRESARDHGAREDRQHDEEPAARSARGERSRNARAERHGGQRVAGVVDEVGEQRDAAGGDVDRGLGGGGRREERERHEDDAQPGAGAGDRGVDEAVAMAVPVRACRRPALLGRRGRRHAGAARSRSALRASPARTCSAWEIACSSSSPTWSS